MQKIEFDAMQTVRSMIAAALPAASTDDERPDMHGVSLDVFGDEVQARATNGQWAMRVRHTPSYADDGMRVLIPIPYVTRLLALIGDGLGQLRIIRDDSIVRFEVEKIGRLDLPVSVAEVHLPPIEKAWPLDEPISMDTIGLNPLLMSRLAKAFGMLAPKPTLRFAFHGTGPVVVTCEEADHADALLMPCLLRDAEEESEERQAKLFPYDDEPNGVAKAVDNMRAALAGETVTIKSGDQSVTLKAIPKPKRPSKPAPKAKAKKASKPKKKK